MQSFKSAGATGYGQPEDRLSTQMGSDSTFGSRSSLVTSVMQHSTLSGRRQSRA
ncbi:hypothetical protein K461DRAFT_283262 [Myriangium duriaei CBS 260.36]|uniref:Uncharacterized protein n=1 Tax=Myriangium duriaei CBS 260.36 TaxID=1168546 RepID=A0A9P4MC02_9PEZI|nr:hypothetical protein K461DRAFT_283262 [Myriangium duriaei CBS 260.36]